MVRTFILTIDLEEFDRAQGDRKFQISKKGAEKLVQFLEKENIPATFFTTLSFAEKFPKLVQRISGNNEVALHAFTHTDNYGKMNPERAKERLSSAKKDLEKITNQKIIGFRAPQMAAPEMNVLREIGIKYDSSLHPTFIPGRYSNQRKNRDIHESHGVVRFPVSVTPNLRIPFSWIWFRIFGVWFSRMCTRSCEKKSNHISLYFHPWDFADLTKIKNLPLLYSRKTKKSLIMLGKYVNWLRERGYSVQTMKNYLLGKELV